MEERDHWELSMTSECEEEGNQKVILMEFLNFSDRSAQTWSLGTHDRVKN
jgi:hypothetical protein